jgi:uncharacterized protein with PIN domain
MEMHQPNLPILPFMADAMLDRLARWLRILGYYTVYEKVITDEALIERAMRGNRWLLTRDRRLVLRKLLRTLLASDDVAGQLRQLQRDLAIDLDLTHQRAYRCAHCNLTLTALSHGDAASLFLPFVAEHYRAFLHCRNCRRVFWPGTHWQDLDRRLTAIRARSMNDQP